MSLSKRLRFRVLERDGFRCRYCGHDGLLLEVDHIVARANGGTDDLENLITACKPCNLGKGTKTLRPQDVPCPMLTVKCQHGPLDGETLRVRGPWAFIWVMRHSDGTIRGYPDRWVTPVAGGPLIPERGHPFMECPPGSSIDEGAETLGGYIGGLERLSWYTLEPFLFHLLPGNSSDRLYWDEEDDELYQYAIADAKRPRP